MNNLMMRVRHFFLRIGKALIRLSVDPVLRKDLQQIFWRLDGQMPRLLEEAGPAEMTGAIGEVIADVTGQQATGQRVEAIVTLYNPIAAALRTFQR